MGYSGKQGRTEHVGGADELDELGEGSAHVVAVDLLLQRGGAQQWVLHAQGGQADSAALHLPHQRHQPLHPRAYAAPPCTNRISVFDCAPLRLHA